MKKFLMFFVVLLSAVLLQPLVEVVADNLKVDVVFDVGTYAETPQIQQVETNLFVVELPPLLSHCLQKKINFLQLKKTDKNNESTNDNNRNGSVRLGGLCFLQNIYSQANGGIARLCNELQENKLFKRNGEICLFTEINEPNLKQLELGKLLRKNFGSEQQFCNNKSTPPNINDKTQRTNKDRQYTDRGRCYGNVTCVENYWRSGFRYSCSYIDFQHK